MLYVSLRERIVERGTDPTKANYMKIIKMKARHIEGFLSYTLDIIPRIGETVCIDENHAYDVVGVVHTKRCCAGLWHPEVIVEVVPHLNKHSYDAGNYFIEEEWPLISNLELEEDPK